MKILARYMIRAHVGPFLFAFTALTGLLFLNAVAQRLEEFAGKGLEWTVIGEFMLLSLPHVVALTFPMAILVAVLYTFSDMTSQNEITAMAAGGVHPLRLLVPLTGAGLVLSIVMFGFNDRVLPESNHRLSSLLSDVASKSPTLELREEVINEIHTGDDSRYFLRFRSIDRSQDRLFDVQIFDLSQIGESRTIVAKQGDMAFTEDRSDLYLTLEDGVIYETSRDRPGGFQRMAFRTQILPFRGVGGQLERRVREGRRGDREMTIAMLGERAEEHLRNRARVEEESRRASVEAVQEALGGPEATEAEEILDPDLLDDPFRDDLDEDPERIVDDEDLIIPTPGGAMMDPLVDNVAHVHRVNLTRWDVHRLTSYRYRVEIHKKYAIAFACIIFVLFGAPLAIRFPQGGAGMAIAASVTIFFFYWVGLIAGERLADRGQMNPIVAMWLPNVLLLAVAAYLLKDMARQISTNREGLWDEVRERLRTTLRSLPWRRPREAVEGGEP